MTHTIVLLQPSSPATRTYSDYDNVNEAMEGESRGGRDDGRSADR